MVERVEVLIIGGGLAGLAATAAFYEAGFDVVCIEPAAPPANETSAGADLRSTAVLSHGESVLRDAGVWDALQPHATALEVMRLVALGPDNTELTSVDFDATEIGQPRFGWNLPNWRFRRALAEALPDGLVLYGARLKQLWAREHAARVMLEDGRLLDADLIIGADGRSSAVRQSLGIGVHRHDYGQSALVFTVSHPIAHCNASTEFHAEGGPFTLVPIADQNGSPASAVVWMSASKEAKRLSTLSDDALGIEATRRSAHRFGPLHPIGGRGLWPIVSQRAERLTARRSALIAEAAHVVPPIGAQGLNMSLADIACLLEKSVMHRDALGQQTMLAAYERTRMADIRLRLNGIDALNRAAIAGSSNLRHLRANMLRLLHRTAPIRHGLMRTGLGARS